MKRMRVLMLAMIFPTLPLLVAACSDEPRIYDKNAEAVKVTGGVDEKNLEQMRAMERNQDDMDRLRDSAEKPYDETPEDFPPTR